MSSSWRKVEREIRAKEAQEAAAKAAQDAAAGDAGGVATAAQPAPPGAAAGTPQGPGAPVAKSAPGVMAAEPADLSGAFADPTVLLNPAQDPFAVPAEAASGEAVPKPLRNPKR